MNQDLNQQIHTLCYFWKIISPLDPKRREFQAELTRQNRCGIVILVDVLPHKNGVLNANFQKTFARVPYLAAKLIPLTLAENHPVRAAYQKTLDSLEETFGKDTISQIEKAHRKCDKLLKTEDWETLRFPLDDVRTVQNGITAIIVEFTKNIAAVEKPGDFAEALKTLPSSEEIERTFEMKSQNMAATYWGSYPNPHSFLNKVTLSKLAEIEAKGPYETEDDHFSRVHPQIEKILEPYEAALQKALVAETYSVFLLNWHAALSAGEDPIKKP